MELSLLNKIAAASLADVVSVAGLGDYIMADPVIERQIKQLQDEIERIQEGRREDIKSLSTDMRSMQTELHQLKQTVSEAVAGVPERRQQHKELAESVAQIKRIVERGFFLAKVVQWIAGIIAAIVLFINNVEGLGAAIKSWLGIGPKP